jgi:hypothetical protein
MAYVPLWLRNINFLLDTLPHLQLSTSSWIARRMVPPCRPPVGVALVIHAWGGATFRTGDVYTTGSDRLCGLPWRLLHELYAIPWVGCTINHGEEDCHLGVVCSTLLPLSYGAAGRVGIWGVSSQSSRIPFWSATLLLLSTRRQRSIGMVVCGDGAMPELGASEKLEIFIQTLPI